MVAKNKKKSKTKTTVRIDTYLKRLADEKARREGIRIQHIVNEALKSYLKPKKQDKSWVDKLGSHNLGKQKRELIRENFYKRDE